MLIAWFQVNAEDPEANQYTYVEFPMYYVWKRSAKKWTRRQLCVCIERISFVNPNLRKQYCLRMLLTIVRGATYFEDLRIVHGHCILHSVKPDVDKD